MLQILNQEKLRAKRRMNRRQYEAARPWAKSGMPRQGITIAMLPWTWHKRVHTFVQLMEQGATVSRAMLIIRFLFPVHSYLTTDLGGTGIY